MNYVVLLTVLLVGSVSAMDKNDSSAKVKERKKHTSKTESSSERYLRKQNKLLAQQNELLAENTKALHTILIYHILSDNKRNSNPELMIAGGNSTGYGYNKKYAIRHNLETGIAEIMKTHGYDTLDLSRNENVRNDGDARSPLD